MSLFIPHAYLKTIDGEEVREYSKENFEKAMKELDCRVAEKSDRTLYFIKESKTINGITFYKDDYLEVLKKN